MKTAKVTLNQAKAMYNSGNEELKKLALSLYDEDQLSLPSFSVIKTLVSSQRARVLIPYGKSEEFKFLSALHLVAEYLNGVWRKTDTNAGYYFGHSNLLDGKKEFCDGIRIYSHVHTIPGIVYFKSEKAAIQAIKILKEARFVL